MKYLRLTLSLLFFVPAGVLAGAANQPPSQEAIGIVIGGAAGLFFGLLFGGARGGIISWVYPPSNERWDGK